RRARVAASQAAQSGHEDHDHDHDHEGEAMQDAVVVNETPVVVDDALETEAALTEEAEANLDEQSELAVEANAEASEVEASAPEQEAPSVAENTETDVM